MTSTVHDAIKDAYETIAYVGRPHHPTSPTLLAAIGQLHGLAPRTGAPIAMLEIASGDGSNLLPIAAAHPGGRFVGVDLSARLTASARELAAALGLANTTLIEGDLRALPADIGRFDVIVAHGLYSWVPADVRDALMRAIARHLAPTGVAFVSYNTLPGGWIRKIGFDALKFHTRAITDPAARVAAAREFIDLLVETWRAQPGPGKALAENFARESARDDGGLFHDDLAAVNEPIYVTGFMRHAAAHRLAVFADADPASPDPGGADAALIERYRARGVGMEEQILDFVHLRQLRQSLITHAGARPLARSDPRRAEGLHWAATAGYVRRRIEGGVPADPVGETLAARFPATLSWEELAVSLRGRGAAIADPATAVHAAWVGGIAEPSTHPITPAILPSARPRASAVARAQASRVEFIASLRHIGVRLADDTARTLLPLCDGTRTHAELASALVRAGAVAPGADTAALVERHLAQFASAALFEA